MIGNHITLKMECQLLKTVFIHVQTRRLTFSYASISFIKSVIKAHNCLNGNYFDGTSTIVLHAPIFKKA